jgi:hypothetical protein
MNMSSEIYFLRLILCLLFFNLGYSNSRDSIEVSGHFLVTKNQFKRGNLYQFNSEKIIQTFEIKEGLFLFKLPTSIDAGVYRVNYVGGINAPHTDIIINGKEPVISFELNYVGDNCLPDFKFSDENKKWYDYLKKANSKVKRLTALFDYLSFFSNEFSGKQIVKIYQKERRKYYQLFNEFISDNDTTWAGLLVANTPYYFSDLNKQPVIRDFIRLNFYWEDIDTFNTRLINTPVFAEHIEAYLKKIIEQANTHNSGFKEFEIKKAIDFVIEKFSKNSDTEKFAVEYVKKYLKKSPELEKMVNYVVQKEGGFK